MNSDNPFYGPQTMTLGDPSSGGAGAQLPSGGGAKIVDDTYAPGNPFATDAPLWQQNNHSAATAKLVKNQAAQTAQMNAPTPLLTTLKDTVTGIPGGMAQLLKGVVQHPVSSASAVGGGLLDVGPAAVNGMSSLGNAILNYVYGGTNFAPSKIGQKPVNLPMPGQTFNNYIGNTSDVSNALGVSSKAVAGYEIGQGAVGGILGETGVGGFASKVLGNVTGGQLTADSDTDRVKQAEFDALFGVGDAAARGVLGAVKGSSKVAEDAVKEAKNTTLNTAISSFETPGGPAYNPAVGTKLRAFLSSKDFDNAKTMVDLETKLQEHLGADYTNPEVQSILQPIVDAGHKSVGVATAPKEPLPTGSDPLKVTDLFDTDAATQKAEARAKAKPPETKYIPKDNLGKDEYGHKKMATTEVDSKTGNAVVYYDKSLDSNPEAKKIIIDHEEGHILDKRLGGGNNLSSFLSNGDPKVLDAALKGFAEKQGLTPQAVSEALQKDLSTLAGHSGPMNEQFADAVSAFRKDPAAGMQNAPTFAKLMDYTPHDAPISSRSTSLEKLSMESPLAGKMVEEKMAQVAKDSRAKVRAEKAAAEASGTKDSKFAGTGMDTGKRIERPFKSENINAPEDVENLFRKMSGDTGNMTEARMSKSHEDVKDLARLVGLTPEDLASAHPGSIANTETVAAARQLVLDKAQALMNDLHGIDIANASDKQLAGLRDKYAQLVAMQKSVAGLKSEAGTLLGSLGREISPGENFTLKDVFSKLQQAGIASKDDAGLFAEKVGKDVQLSTAQKVGQGIMKTWYASILSGPATPLRHGLSVMSNLGTDIISKIGNPKLWNEIGPSLKALFGNFGNAFQDAKDAFKGTGKEAEAFRNITDSSQTVFTGKWAGYGKAVEMVGRYMDAAATGYTRLAKEVEAASLEVNSGRMSKEVQEALATSYAESINYLDEPKGATGRALQQAARAATRQSPVLRFIVPFTKVVANVLDRQFDYIPGVSFWRATETALDHQVTGIMKKFDLESEADRTAIMGRLQAQQIGRATVGMAVASTAFVAAKSGLISGSGPSDYNKKIELERTGWRPDSIKIGDHWVPYDYLGPLGGILSMVGNVYDKTTYDGSPNDQDISKLLEKGIVGWTQSQLNKSFLKGVSDLLGALTDPTKAETYLTKFGAEFVPVPKAVSGTRAIVNAAMGNEYQYQTHSIVDRIRVELGLTGSIAGMPALNPSVNAFGEPLKADIIFGITPTATKADGVDNYLQANDITITIPSKNTKYTDPANGGAKRALTDTEYAAYVKQSGQEIYKNMEGMIPDLQGQDVDTQRAEIRAMLDEVRTQTRDTIMSGN